MKRAVNVSATRVVRRAAPAPLDGDLKIPRLNCPLTIHTLHIIPQSRTRRMPNKGVLPVLLFAVGSYRALPLDRAEPCRPASAVMIAYETARSVPFGTHARPCRPALMTKYAYQTARSAPFSTHARPGRPALMTEYAYQTARLTPFSTHTRPRRAALMTEYAY